MVIFRILSDIEQHPTVLESLQEPPSQENEETQNIPSTVLEIKPGTFIQPGILLCLRCPMYHLVLTMASLYHVYPENLSSYGTIVSPIRFL